MFRKLWSGGLAVALTVLIAAPAHASHSTCYNQETDPTDGWVSNGDDGPRSLTNARDIINTLDGMDNVNALDGNDLICLGPNSEPGTSDYVDGGSGVDHLRGNAHNDILWGRADNDVLRAHDGNDFLYGNANLAAGSHDNLFAGNGADDLYGGDQNDQLWDGYSRDLLEGNAGYDKWYFCAYDADDVYTVEETVPPPIGDPLKHCVEAQQ